ncbi:MAG: N-acetylneuraminate synthase family protein [Candidatus Omnitrophica bacterium]|nr:N-acetylneuraminate synthase family protein [Candidatus Omnitrophota bacterium]
MMRFKDIDGIYLIGEIGINHNGDLNIAKRLIDAVFACHWNCAKFQKRNPDKCIPEKQKKVLRDTPWGRMTYLEYKKKIEFGREEYDYIDKYCREKPIDWTASVWDMDSLRFSLGYKMPFIKIPSAKISDLKLIETAAKTGVPIIASTGMSSMKEVDDLVDVLKRYASDFALMHTNSSYPTPKEELNINCVKTLKKRYGCVIGYSGHEYNVEPTVYASVLGAKIIERHITLNHGMWGTDHAASLEVAAMDMLRKRIRDIDAIMGDGEKRIMPSEKDIRKKLKK